ncbi:ArdC-like ssDNA-binding domain-containing protein [Bacillus altitudinis]|uniref:ArdC-like ssDNA-binding domain-containing protein n=1 Tax=Bacillus altitudinis TaxID=293387 RepID=UPI0020BDC181|nr:ArdC-like ssDNA-binding domain-containing protein [Bacillus altitudinis]
MINLGFYSTFTGEFTFDRPLDNSLYDLLNGLAATRRMARNIEGFGEEGEFYIDGDQFDDNIIDPNKPPGSQPSLNLESVPSENKRSLKWSGHDSFHDPEGWLQYLVTNVFEPKGYLLNGTVNVVSEREVPDDNDGSINERTHISIQNNLIKTGKGHVDLSKKNKDNVYQRKTKSEIATELTQLSEKVKQAVKETVINPEEYKRYLDYASKFPQRSMRNQMLIFKQRPGADLVAGLKAWNKQGRQVIKGTKAIKVFAPVMGKETEVDEKTKEQIEKTVIKGYKAVNVYDVNDTKGVPLPVNPVMPSNVQESDFANKVFPHLLKELRKDLPINLDDNYPGEANGHYNRLQHAITIKTNGRDTTNQCKTLIHEYAHSQFHSVFSKYALADEQTREFQAESTAYLSLKSFGLDTSDFSFPYLKGWAGTLDDDKLIQLQTDIQKESAKLIRRIEDVIIENDLKFEVPTTLRENTLSKLEGEGRVRLIELAGHYSLVKGECKEGLLNNLDSFKQVGEYLGQDRDRAIKGFEIQQGQVPLVSCEQLDKNKGSMHLYKRQLTSGDNVYFVGAASLTNVKAVTPSTANLEAAASLYEDITKGKSLGSAEKLLESLKTRDSDRDGLTDYQEMRLGTNPLNPDTDNDGIPDGRDVSPKTPTPNRGQELSL